MSIHKVMKGEEGICKPLPEELVQKIVAMMPYPWIFKGRLISKAWHARFEPISSLRDAEEKSLATTFQRQVRKWSQSWDTFRPFSITAKDLFAYNRRSQCWQGIQMKSVIPKLSGLIPAKGNSLSWQKTMVHIEGALLYGLWRSRHGRCLLVINIFTRTWMELQPPPGFSSWSGTIHWMKLIINPSSEAYKLVLCCRDPPPIKHQVFYYLLVYDSNSETWISKRFLENVNSYIKPSSLAYLDGVLYNWSIRDKSSLVVFNMEQWTIEGLDMLFIENISLLTGELTVCNASLILVTFETDHVVYVRRIDVKSRCWREIAACHVDDFKSGMIDKPISDSHQVFFRISDKCTGVSGGAIVVYNQHSDEWSFVNFPEPDHAWDDYSFQPGLNPFLAV